MANTTEPFVTDYRSTTPDTTRFITSYAMKEDEVEIDTGNAYGITFIYAVLIFLPMFLWLFCIWRTCMLFIVRFCGKECKALLISKHEDTRRYFQLQFVVKHSRNKRYSLCDTEYIINDKYFQNYDENDIVIVKYSSINRQIHNLKEQIDDSSGRLFLLHFLKWILYLLLPSSWMSLFFYISYLSYNHIGILFLILNSFIIMILIKIFCYIANRVYLLNKGDLKYNFLSFNKYINADLMRCDGNRYFPVFKEKNISKDEYERFHKKLYGQHNDSVAVQMITSTAP